jgi:hypothetical protein
MRSDLSCKCATPIWLRTTCSQAILHVQLRLTALVTFRFVLMFQSLLIDTQISRPATVVLVVAVLVHFSVLRGALMLPFNKCFSHDLLSTFARKLCLARHQSNEVEGEDGHCAMVMFLIKAASCSDLTSYTSSSLTCKNGHLVHFLSMSSCVNLLPPGETCAAYIAPDKGTAMSQIHNTLRQILLSSRQIFGLLLTG